MSDISISQPYISKSTSNCLGCIPKCSRKIRNMDQRLISNGMNNFKLITEVSPNVLEAIRMELYNVEGSWGKLPFRTSFEGSPHREVEDILIRGPKLDTDDMWDLYNRIPCINYLNEDALPIVQSTMMDIFHLLNGTALGRVVLTRLPPSGHIYEHIDEGEAADWYDRFHLVISSAEIGNFFYSGDERQEMRTGQLWWVNNHIEHSVHNMSDEDRIHMILDIQRN
jgi:hypothetical protein